VNFRNSAKLNIKSYNFKWIYLKIYLLVL
jgi:hypothetical protein